MSAVTEPDWRLTVRVKKVPKAFLLNAEHSDAASIPRVQSVFLVSAAFQLCQISLESFHCIVISCPGPQHNCKLTDWSKKASVIGCQWRTGASSLELPSSALLLDHHHHHYHHGYHLHQYHHHHHHHHGFTTSISTSCPIILQKLCKLLWSTLNNVRNLKIYHCWFHSYFQLPNMIVNILEWVWGFFMDPVQLPKPQTPNRAPPHRDPFQQRRWNNLQNCWEKASLF